MKIAVAVFVALVAPLCLAAPQGYDYNAPAAASAAASAAAPAPAPTAAPATYNYGYNVDAVDALGSAVQFGHQEARQGAATTGRYFVLLPDTRLMTVDYVVDATGFHPTYTFQGTAQYPVASPAQGQQAALATPTQIYAAPGGK